MKKYSSRFSAIVLPCVVTLFGCGAGDAGDAGESSADQTATRYVDILDYWKAPTDISAWRELLARMEGEFDNVCGDTFCSGDYSNLTSQGLTCSVTSARGILHECVWAFVGSSHLVNRATGQVEASIGSFPCRFAPKIGARAMLKALDTAPGSAIQLPLSGLHPSIYDELGECFQHPVGATPINQGMGTAYADAPDSRTTDQGAWFSATDALRQNFDEICGDTYCSGGFPHFQALRFACSVKDTTGAIRACKWLFGGSYSTIDAGTGAITVHSKADRCAVPVKGTSNQLSEALNATSAIGPIDRPLPGTIKSARDALRGCL